MVERLISIPSPKPLIQAFQKVNSVGERPRFNPSRIRFLLLSGTGSKYPTIAVTCVGGGCNQHSLYTWNAFCTIKLNYIYKKFALKWNVFQHITQWPEWSKLKLLILPIFICLTLYFIVILFGALQEKHLLFQSVNSKSELKSVEWYIRWPETDTFVKRCLNYVSSCRKCQKWKVMIKIIYWFSWFIGIIPYFSVCVFLWLK